MRNFDAVREQVISRANTFYAASATSGDMDTACFWLGELMALKAIEPTDRRLKELKRNDMPLFARDYRSGVDFTPKWVAGNVPSVFNVALTASAYDATRIEGNYEGMIRVGEREMQLEINEVKTPGVSKKLNEMIEKVNKDSNRGKISLDISGMHQRGEVAVHKIGLAHGQSFLASEFGYIVTARPSLEGKMRVLLILNTKNFEKCHVNVKKATRAIGDKMEGELWSLNGGCEVEVVSIDKMFKKA